MYIYIYMSDSEKKTEIKRLKKKLKKIEKLKEEIKESKYPYIPPNQKDLLNSESTLRDRLAGLEGGAGGGGGAAVAAVVTSNPLMYMSMEDSAALIKGLPSVNKWDDDKIIEARLKLAGRTAAEIKAMKLAEEKKSLLTDKEMAAVEKKALERVAVWKKKMGSGRCKGGGELLLAKEQVAGGGGGVGGGGGGGGVWDEKLLAEWSEWGQRR